MISVLRSQNLFSKLNNSFCFRYILFKQINLEGKEMLHLVDILCWFKQETVSYLLKLL